MRWYRQHRRRLGRVEAYQRAHQQYDRRVVVVSWGSAEPGEDLHDAAARLGLLTAATLVILPEKAPDAEQWAARVKADAAARGRGTHNIRAEFIANVLHA